MKAVICVETGIEYNSLAEAARETGAYQSGICQALKLGCRCKGFHWIYARDGSKMQLQELYDRLNAEGRTELIKFAELLVAADYTENAGTN